MSTLPENGVFYVVNTDPRYKKWPWSGAVCLQTRKLQNLKRGDFSPIGWVKCSKRWTSKLIAQAYTSGRLCASGPDPEDPESINEEYFTYQLKKTDMHIIMAELTSGGKPVVRGFVLADYVKPTATAEDEDDLHIELICANRPKAVETSKSFSGMTLLTFTMEVARFLGFHTVSLSAIPSVLGFYPKLGFEFRRTCAGPAIALPNKLKTARLQGGDAFAPENSAYADFLFTLHEAGIEEAHSCKKIKNLPKEETLDEMQKQHCDSEGYHMAKCGIQNSTTSPSSLLFPDGLPEKGCCIS